MFNSLKNLYIVLAIGLFLNQSTMAMDNDAPQEPKSTAQTALPTTYQSEDSAINELIAKDPIKNFAFQAMKSSETADCACQKCTCYKLSSVRLWNDVRDAENTASSQIKDLFTQYANHNCSFTRLPQTMQTWLQENGYRTAPIAQPMRISTLDLMLAIMDLVTTQSEGTPGIVNLISENFPNNGNQDQSGQSSVSSSDSEETDSEGEVRFGDTDSEGEEWFSDSDSEGEVRFGDSDEEQSGQTFAS